VWRSLSKFDESSTNYFSVGYLVPGVQIKIIHPRTEKSRPKNKIGEICVKSKQMISKNRNLSIVTRNAFTIDGFFKTGDAGYYDKDGLLYVECRVNELIYCGNEEIMPLSLETILLKHSSVKDVAVIGVSDPKYGEIARAFVVLHQRQSVTEKILLDYIEMRGKQLRGGIIFVDSIPKTARSKANRIALRTINDNLHTYSFIEKL
jgi:acyl-CoA synthetase (AMP-forming)/AMP-acid ligase II